MLLMVQVSASMDKNIKIWGTTFGECRKSIFAHDDSVTAVSFCRGTHYFFSVSRDCTIKYWDADHFCLVQIIRSHMEVRLFALEPQDQG